MENHGKKAALHNLGCKVNAYETEAMQQQLEAAGYEIVPFAPGADVYVINTCSVTNIADRKSRQMLHRAKKMNPEAVIVAAGCYVQTARERTGLEVEADVILGNNKKQNLLEALEKYQENREKAKRQELQELIDINHTREYENLFITRTEAHTRAYIKVQDGCDQFCSYCIIPYARGRARSRDMQDILRELRTLAGNGVKEVVLTGIHLSSYGKDLGTDLVELIKRVDDLEGIRRIRLGSLEPGIVTEPFARELKNVSKFCPHFHLSLQSGCDTVLKRMNRRYTTEEYLERCRLLREVFDRPALTTDVIVGFPGETEEEFAATVEFLEKVKFYETHIFKYSRRKGTRAAGMPDQIPEQQKSLRSDRLLELHLQNKRAYEAQWLGQTCEALLEERVVLAEKEYFTGYTKEYLKIFYEAANGSANRLVTGTLERLPGREELVLQ